MAYQYTGRLPDHFGLHHALAADLLPHALTVDHDGAHDASHLCRVWSLASRIARADGGDVGILAAAVFLHDCVPIPKASPQRVLASRLSGAKARTVLTEHGWNTQRISAVVHAIEAHSFSAEITPRTIEAMILRDADRLDAIGAIGVARCFIVAGRLGRPLYDISDPLAVRRDLDDATWTLEAVMNRWPVERPV